MAYKSKEEHHDAQEVGEEDVRKAEEITHEQE
jgi:hypothetical protein